VLLSVTNVFSLPGLVERPAGWEGEGRRGEGFGAFLTRSVGGRDVDTICAAVQTALDFRGEKGGYRRGKGVGEKKRLSLARGGFGEEQKLLIRACSTSEREKGYRISERREGKRSGADGPLVTAEGGNIRSRRAQTPNVERAFFFD